MSVKSNMLAALKGDLPDQIPYIPRLELWYAACMANNILPEQYKNTSMEDIAGAEGWGIYRITSHCSRCSDFSEELPFYAIGVYALQESPYQFMLRSVGLTVVDLGTDVDADRFLQEVHPKLRPVELAVAGVLLAGTCQSPMDIGEAANASASAAVKASSLLARGFVELDPFIGEVDLSKCSGTGACVEACLQEGALTLVEMEVAGEKVQRAEVNPALCTGCGACVAVCPEDCIQMIQRT